MSGREDQSAANPNDGYSVPVHRSLVNRPFYAGLPREFCLALWTTTAALGFGMRELWVIPIGIILHMLFAQLAKREPYFMEVFIEALKAPRRLDP